MIDLFARFARSEKRGILFNTKLYGPNAFDPKHSASRKIAKAADRQQLTNGLDPLQTDSPWPARNAKEFLRLNSLMERYAFE